MFLTGFIFTALLTAFPEENEGSVAWVGSVSWSITLGLASFGGPVTAKLGNQLTVQVWLLE